MENKHAEFMKTADIIIKKGGDCRNIGCSKCPASYIRKINDYDSCSDAWYMELRTKLQWFINWKKENEVNPMSEKIQMTEEYVKNSKLIDLIKCPAGISENCMETITCTDCKLNLLKKSGFIRKSLLQQKVERIEEALDDYISGHSVDVLDTFTGALEIIKILKEYHPEFKS